MSTVELADVIEAAMHDAETEFAYASETGVGYTFMGRPLSYLIPYRVAEALAVYMPQLATKEK